MRSRSQRALVLMLANEERYESVVVHVDLIALVRRRFASWSTSHRS